LATFSVPDLEPVIVAVSPGSTEVILILPTDNQFSSGILTLPWNSVRGASTST